MRILLACCCVTPAAWADDAATTDDALGRAMRDEMTRTMAELRLEELSRPYFVAYRVDEIESVVAAASFGSPVSEDHGRARWLTVEVRVGDRELDNTNFLAFPSFGESSFGGFGGVTSLPLDDDYRELRRQLWLATDSAYKSALEDLAKKRAALENKTRSEELPDFSVAEPVTTRDVAPVPELDATALGALVTPLSAIFRELEGIAISEVRAQAEVARVRYLNSEGTSFERLEPVTRLVAWASTQAEDGMRLEDAIAFYGRAPDELPPEDELAAAVRALGERLRALRGASLVERYNGPVLFEGQAAAELFAQVFAPKLLAQRQPVTADERLAMMIQARAGEGGGDFLDRVGARVLPRFLSVHDDPTRVEHEGAPLYGGYEVDDQGVKGAPTALIERGYLKTLLTDRTPVRGIEKSSGNSRAGGVAPTNLIVSAGEGQALDDDELRRELMTLVADRGADYGVLVRRVLDPRLAPPMRRGFGGPGAIGPSPVEAWQIFPDGREVLLRNVEITALTAATFKEIIAVSEDADPHSVVFEPARTNPFSGMMNRSGPPVVTLVVPDLLFEEVTLKKPTGEIPTPPVAEHPYFDKETQ